MRDEEVICVAGHPLLNRRCTRLPGCIRLRNDLYCVEWGVKLYSLTHPVCYEALHMVWCVINWIVVVVIIIIIIAFATDNTFGLLFFSGILLLGLMHLIKLWIWICPLVLVATVIVNVYLLSSLHVTKCKSYSVLDRSVLFVIA